VFGGGLVMSAAPRLRIEMMLLLYIISPFLIIHWSVVVFSPFCQTVRVKYKKSVRTYKHNVCVVTELA
jgi:hypothetical protein